MARGLNEARQRAAAHQASRRMIARGDRPAYRVTSDQDGRWHVDALPWLSVTATGRHEALDEARVAIAEWLDVPPDAHWLDWLAVRRRPESRQAGRPGRHLSALA